jgi:hypothetical protein
MFLLIGFLVTSFGVVLHRRRPRDADLIVRRERAMVVLAEIARDLQQVEIPAPPNLHVVDSSRGYVTVPASASHRSVGMRRRPPRRHRPMQRQSFDLGYQPTVAYLPSVPRSES